MVVSKIGYVQGRNLELAEQREAAGAALPRDGEVRRPASGTTSIRSSSRTSSAARWAGWGWRRSTCCLLHNPEYFLRDAHERSHGTLEKRRVEFYATARAQAFAWLEMQVAAGRIRCYGVSSNTCTSPPDDPEATSLTRCSSWRAKAGGADHHFRVLQLPLNLFESGAALERNSGPGGTQTVLEHAAQEGLAVLVNRPLNAFVDEGMMRLAEVTEPGDEIAVEAQARGGEPPGG